MSSFVLLYNSYLVLAAAALALYFHIESSGYRRVKEFEVTFAFVGDVDYEIK